MAKKKRWSETIEHVGIKITIFEKPNSVNFHYNITSDGERVRGSLKTKNRKLARERAKATAESVARKRLNHEQIGSPTLDQVFDLYFRERAPDLEPAWRISAETRRRLFERAWGRDMKVADLSETHIIRFSKKRMSGDLCPEGGKRKGVRAGSVDNDCRWLSTVLIWATRHKVGRRPVLDRNPLSDLPKRKEWGQSRWPKEKNPLRPVASHDRYLKTLAKADRVDPTGRLACMLSLARYTGHRESSICGLRASDLLLDATSIRRTIADIGGDERRADHMPHGAILWREESDKEKYREVIPMSASARTAVAHYLRQSPRLGDTWLFPSPKHDARPIRRDLAGRWLVRAERLAEIPKLAGGIWHPYRRLWGKERKHLPDADVAFSGGWRDERALKLAYQAPDPETTLSVVEEAG